VISPNALDRAEGVSLSEPPQCGASGRRRRHCGRLPCCEAIHKPGRRTGRWSTVIGSDRLASFVDSSRPPLAGPKCRHCCDGSWIGDLAGGALNDEIEVADGHAQRTPRIFSQISALARALTCLEPEGAVDPRGADSSHVWAAVGVDSGQPTGVPVRAARLRHLGDAFGEPSLDLGPVEHR